MEEDEMDMEEEEEEVVQPTLNDKGERTFVVEMDFTIKKNDDEESSKKYGEWSLNYDGRFVPAISGAFGAGGLYDFEEIDEWVRNSIKSQEEWSKHLGVPTMKTKMVVDERKPAVRQMTLFE